MKKLLLSILLICFNSYPQEETAPAVELFFGTEQASGDPITFYLSNKGQVWGGEQITAPCVIDYYLTNDFDYPTYTVTNHNQPLGSWAGLEFTTSITYFYEFDVYGYGLYKVTNSESSSSFYIDYRDHRIGCNDYGTVGHHIDMKIKYNAATNSYSYNRHDGTSNFYSISNGQYLTLWEIKNAGRPQTDQLPDFWDYALALIPSQSGNNPKLVWGPHPDDNIYLDITGYNIYRAIDGGSYSKIAEVNENTFSYIDTYFMLGGSTEAHYKVTANYQDLMESTQETSSTNTVTADVGLYKEISRLEMKFDFELVQNFPNPFNPTTQIKFAIPKDGFVTLKEYDLLGREVATLVNESKTAANYSVNFDASTLASGTYIYQLKAGEFLSSKKMLLIK